MAEINSEVLNEVEGGTNVPTSGRYITYVVKSGDCLSVLAERYNTTVDELVRINQIKNPDLIYAGQLLYIPVK